MNFLELRLIELNHRGSSIQRATSLKAYTSIMQDRFPDKFDIHISCASDLEQMLIPPLLLQPLVENCFKHGRLDTLSRFGERGIIELKIEREQDKMVISLTDNGDAQSLLQSSTVTQLLSRMK